MKTMTLVIVDDCYTNRSYHSLPTANTVQEFDEHLNKRDKPFVYTANYFLYDYFRLLIKRGVLDYQTSCAIYDWKNYYVDKAGRSENHPPFYNQCVDILAELL